MSALIERAAQRAQPAQGAGEGLFYVPSKGDSAIDECANGGACGTIEGGEADHATTRGGAQDTQSSACKTEQKQKGKHSNTRERAAAPEPAEPAARRAAESGGRGVHTQQIIQ